SRCRRHANLAEQHLETVPTEPHVVARSQRRQGVALTTAAGALHGPRRYRRRGDVPDPHPAGLAVGTPQRRKSSGSTTRDLMPRQSPGSPSRSPTPPRVFISVFVQPDLRKRWSTCWAAIPTQTLSHVLNGFSLVTGVIQCPI